MYNCGISPGVMCVCVCWGGGGGTLMFPLYVGLDPASTVYQKIWNSKHSTKYLKFNNPKNIPFLYIDLKKRL